MKTAYSLKPATPAEKRQAAAKGITLQPDYLDDEEAEAIEAAKAGHYEKATREQIRQMFPPVLKAVR